MIHRVALFLAVAVLASSQQSSAPGRRLALVIANSDYPRPTNLVSPPNEAKLISEALTDARFDVTRVNNMHTSDFIEEIETNFLPKVRPDDTVVFYYAGYAVHDQDDNYLVPVDFEQQSTQDLQNRAYNLRRMAQKLDDRGVGLKIFILESAGSIGTRIEGASAGMKEQPDISKDSLFAFAASPGQIVPETNEIGLFTKSIVNSLKVNGRGLVDVFRDAQKEVEASTTGQTPSIQDEKVRSNFFFTYPALTVNTLVNTLSLDFTSPTPETVPAAKTLIVTAAGAADYKARFRVTAPAEAKWLTVSKVSGTTSENPNLTVSVNPKGLTPGTYEDTITISATDSDVTSSPQAVKVSYTILAEKRPGYYIDSKDDEEYVFISAGSFKMGCVPAAEQRCKENEKPQHRVTITKSFWMGRNEVQVDSYKKFVKAQPKKKMPSPGPLWDKPWREGGNRPISLVSWEDAHEYCLWAGGRLPTEAEWEFAARAGVSDLVLPPRDQANFHGVKLYDEQPAPVKHFAPNTFGLYDMAGNVWEWVSDYYAPRYYSDSPAIDPKGPPNGSQHVMRGGSFDSDPDEHLRISFRDQGKTWPNVGFRCVLDDTDATRKLLSVR